MQNILVTGSSSGIGKASVESLAMAGHRVFATMRNTKDGIPLLELAAKESLHIEVVKMDVTDETLVNNAFNQVFQQVDFLDAIVCNAGIPGFGAVEEAPMSTFYNCMEVNFFGVVRCVKKVIPTMREKRAGCIVIVSSIGGRFALSPSSSYAPSKHALEAFSEALAQEAKYFGIRVAVLEPGAIVTAITEKAAKSVGRTTRYPRMKELIARLEHNTETGMPAEVVGDQIRDIIEGDSWQFRYPMGEDAKHFIKIRNSMSDEEWIDLYSLECDEFEKAMAQINDSIK